MTRNAVLRRLLVEARPYYPRLILGLALGAVAGLGPLAYAPAFRLLQNDVFNNPHHDLRELWLIVLGMFAITAIANTAAYGQNYLTALSGQSMIASLRVRLFERVLRLPLGAFDRWRPGEVVARFMNDLNLMTDAVSISLPQMIQTTITFIGALGGMLWTDWLLALCLFVSAPFVSWSVGRFNKLITDKTGHAQARIADLSSNLTEVLGNERIVKAFGTEEYEVERFRHNSEAYLWAYMKVTQLGQTQTPVIATIIMLAVILVIVFSAHEVAVGRMDSGSVGQFWIFVALAINPMNRFAVFLADFARALVGAERVFEVLDLDVERRDEPGAVALPHVDGEIVFEDVTFGYQADRPVLERFSARIDAGEIVALVGPSGAGKTTIVNLVPRFFEPQKGQITLDGIDLGKIRLADLRAAIAIVPQETALFNGTLAENIRYGKLDASDDEVRAAAREANADEFIVALADGYRTLVGERGIRLSGGQRQRIAIARAILRDPRILILDEATSQLDSHSEDLIEQALDRILTGRTTFIIAHRLSTVMRASKILYIERGQVLEVGTHESLLAQGGRYARLHATQFAQPRASL
jgi:subfamily B ATP-binding cassette protein MsbA